MWTRTRSLDVVVADGKVGWPGSLIGCPRCVHQQVCNQLCDCQTNYLIAVSWQASLIYFMLSLSHPSPARIALRVLVGVCKHRRSLDTQHWETNIALIAKTDNCHPGFLAHNRSLLHVPFRSKWWKDGVTCLWILACTHRRRGQPFYLNRLRAAFFCRFFGKRPKRSSNPACVWLYVLLLLLNVHFRSSQWEACIYP